MDVAAAAADSQAQTILGLLGTHKGSILLDKFWERFDAGYVTVKWFVGGDEEGRPPTGFSAETTAKDLRAIRPSPFNRDLSETVVEDGGISKY